MTSNELIAASSETLWMFLYLAAELSILFIAISFAVEVIQQWLPAGKIQSILSAKRRSAYVSAAALGAITPFCSCSTIPMLNGLLRAGAGFGPTMTFLFVSPLLNPIVIGLLLVTFNLKVTTVYVVATLTIALVAGYALEKLRFQRFIRLNVTNVPSGGTSQAAACSTTAASVGNLSFSPQASASSTCCAPASEPVSRCTPSPDLPASSCCSSSTPPVKPATAGMPWGALWRNALKQFRDVAPYLLLGVAIGAFTYGFIPGEWISRYTAADNPLAIPFAAVVGIPLYLRAEALIPMASAFALKGMGIGPLMALIIGGAGASLTEVILLASLFRRRLLAAFLAVILGTAMAAGFAFSALSPWLGL